MLKLLYQQDDFPVFQNRMYESKEKTINRPKGVILALLKARSGQPVKTVIDINPAKLEQFNDGKGLRVESTAHGLLNIQTGETIYIMNSNSSRRNKENVK
jgi:hypothetical protein